MIGQTIERYKILEKIGEGGMGVVYKAQDTKLDRIVALKFLPDHQQGGNDEQARFIQEAKSAASLNHPNICTVHGIEEIEQRQFIVMEYVEGKTLGEKRESLTPKQALDIAIQISEGLSAAHDRGIVHRDIKPDNIMIRKDGLAQIMDFGLAKLRGVSNLTKQGHTVGTARYMSPEQIQGADIDYRSDIFSLGVVFYELFTGQLPFKGVHETALLYEIVNVDAQPMSVHGRSVPPELDAIVLSCLAKEPSERFQSAAEIARLLRQLKKSTTRISAVQKVSAHAAGGPSPSSAGKSLDTGAGKIRFWAITSLVLLIGLVVTIAVHLSESSSKPMTIQFTVTPEDGASVGSMALSPDGSKLAYTAAGDGRNLLWIRPMSQLKSYSLAGTEGANYPFWSPQGDMIGFFAEGKLKKISIAGGVPVVICDAPLGRGGSWNQSGEILIAPTIASVIHKVSSAGGTPEPVTRFDTTQGQREHIWPFFLPDGERFLYSSRRYDHDDHVVYIGSLAGDQPRRVVASQGNVQYSQTGHLLFLSDRTLFAQRFDPASGQLSGEPHQIVENPGLVPLTGLSAFTVSANGVLATGGGRVETRQYAWFDRTGTRLETVVQAGNFFDISLSPDGLKAAVQYDPQGHASDIYVIDLKQKSLTQFTFTADTEDDPIWSPDGSSIVFSLFGPESPALVYRKRASGAGEEQLLPVNGRASDWSRDGKYILFYGWGNGDVSYLENGPESQSRAYLDSPASELYGQFSPNGKYVAYASNESGTYEVYVQTFPTRSGKWRISKGGGSQPRWRKDGGELFYIAPDRTLTVVETSFTNEFTYGAPKALFRTQVDDYDAPNRYVVSNDGKRFLINVPAERSNANPVTVTVNWTSPWSNN